MSQPSRVKPSDSKGKFVLIAVLAVILVSVIASNFTQGHAEPASAEQAEAVPEHSDTSVKSTDTAVEQADRPTGPFAEFADDRHWPSLTLEEIAEFDPLTVPAWAGPPPPSTVGTGREYSQEQLDALNNAENAIILVSGNKRVALIGTQEFRVGDMIGSLRISDISSKGIVLSEPE